MVRVSCVAGRPARVAVVSYQTGPHFCKSALHLGPPRRGYLLCHRWGCSAYQMLQLIIFNNNKQECDLNDAITIKTLQQQCTEDTRYEVNISVSGYQHCPLSATDWKISQQQTAHQTSCAACSGAAILCPRP